MEIDRTIVHTGQFNEFGRELLIGFFMDRKTGGMEYKKVDGRFDAKSPKWITYYKTEKAYRAAITNINDK